MPTPKKAPAKRKAESAGGGSTKRQATGGAGGDAGEGGAAVKLKKAKPEALDVAGQLARELGVEEWRVRGAMKLFADGATLPFVARSALWKLASPE
ncbi:hypothetical protein T484DRAFT_1820696 [Baffinella frigidus]|nr:hypothetical protein T484DRAFT_1820696 [Cryptophyta sp. CCMP2293]